VAFVDDVYLGIPTWAIDLFVARLGWVGEKAAGLGELVKWILEDLVLRAMSRLEVLYRSEDSRR
jgi:hypothetical protein